MGQLLGQPFKIIADNGKNSDEKIKEFVKNIIIN
jgi:hypothetical protein